MPWYDIFTDSDEKINAEFTKIRATIPIFTDVYIVPIKPNDYYVVLVPPHLEPVFRSFLQSFNARVSSKQVSKEGLIDDPS